MKKSKLELLGLIGISIVSLSSCEKISKEDDSTIVKRCCEKYISEYEIVDKNSDSVQVSINAPDLKKILETIYKEKGNQEITDTDIEKTVNEHPEYKREYKFWCDSEKNYEIENDFLEEVSKDLITEAIKSVRYREEWSTEE